MVSELRALVPSNEPQPPFFFLPTLPLLCICGADLQWDVEQRDGAEDSYLVNGREAIRLIVQKSSLLIEATDYGNEDDSAGEQRR